MMMPSSYKSAYQRREAIVQNVYDEGRLNVDRAVGYVQNIHTDGQMQDFLEALESKDELFPQMPYTHEDDELEYFQEVDYDLSHLVQAFAEMRKMVPSSNPTTYYGMFPFNVDDETMYSIVPINKGTFILDLKAYQRNPDFVQTNDENAPKGLAEKLHDYDEGTIDRAQQEIDDRINGERLNVDETYRVVQDIVDRYFPKILEE